MSPCQHGWHGDGGDRSVTAPCVSLCLSRHPAHPQHSSNKVIYSHANGVAPLWGHRGGHGVCGDLGTAGNRCHHLQPCRPSRGGVTVKEGSGGRGEGGTLLGRAGIRFPRRGVWRSRWQQAGKRLRPHGNGPSCEEMGWEEPGSGGDSAVPAGPAAVSVGGHWDPHGHCGGCWRSGVTPQRRVWGTPESRESGACPLWG